MEADGYEELRAADVPAPTPLEKQKLPIGYVMVVLGIGLFILGLSGDSLDAPFTIVPAVFLIGLGGYGIVYYSDIVRRYYHEPAEKLAVCVRSKDFLSRASEAEPQAGVYMVSFVTERGNERTAELALEKVGLVAPGDVGVAGLRIGRLIEFRRLDVRYGRPPG